jgi:hypothetical protein
VVTTGDVAARKRPEERPSRLTIEYYGPGEDELITRLRVSAVQRKEPVRDWVLRAIRHELERLERQERAQPEQERQDDRPPG